LLLLLLLLLIQVDGKRHGRYDIAVRSILGEATAATTAAAAATATAAAAATACCWLVLLHVTAVGSQVCLSSISAVAMAS
jgi:hypothetical protein